MEMIRDLGPAVLELVPDEEGLDLAVSYDVGGRPWLGVASFPWEMEDEAISWMERIESVNDLEDLFREWATEETWTDFQRVRNVVGA